MLLTAALAVLGSVPLALRLHGESAGKPGDEQIVVVVVVVVVVGKGYHIKWSTLVV